MEQIFNEFGQFKGHSNGLDFLLLDGYADEDFSAGIAGLPLTDLDGGFVDFVEEGDAFVD